MLPVFTNRNHVSGVSIEGQVTDVETKIPLSHSVDEKTMPAKNRNIILRENLFLEFGFIIYGNRIWCDHYTAVSTEEGEHSTKTLGKNLITRPWLYRKFETNNYQDNDSTKTRDKF